MRSCLSPRTASTWFQAIRSFTSRSPYQSESVTPWSSTSTDREAIRLFFRAFIQHARIRLRKAIDSNLHSTYPTLSRPMALLRHLPIPPGMNASLAAPAELDKQDLGFRVWRSARFSTDSPFDSRRRKRLRQPQYRHAPGTPAPPRCSPARPARTATPARAASRSSSAA